MSEGETKAAETVSCSAWLGASSRERSSAEQAAIFERFDAGVDAAIKEDPIIIWARRAYQTECITRDAFMEVKRVRVLEIIISEGGKP